MKKITLLLLTICNVFLFAQANRTTDVTPAKFETKPIVYKYPTKAFVTLQDYYNEFNAQNLIAPRLYGQTLAATDYISSQQFETTNTQYNANAADDFKVPANKIWNITAVNVNGTLTLGVYPTSYNVTFYANSGTNLPGAVLRTETVTLTTGSASPSIPLATVLSLAEGTYWVSVQAVLDLNGGGQWYWSTYNDTSTLNQPYAWRNPGNGFGTNCSTNWNTASICATGQLKDLQFSLDGTESVPCKVFTGRILPTDPTHSPRINRNGVHPTCGIVKAYPGNFSSGNFHYKSYTIQNASSSTTCVTISLKNTDPNSSNQVHLTAYAGSFNPGNLSQNYLGDIGNSSLAGAVETMSINIPGNSTVVLVASEVTENTVFTADFTINVITPNCGDILKTVENPKNAVNIYPNPTSSVLFVNGMQPKQANVFDVSGKQIPTKVDGNKIDTQKLPKGNYILKMEDKEGKSSTTKFIKK